MGDFVLSVIPTDPHWQPDPEAAERCAELVGDLLAHEDADFDLEIDVEYHERIAIVHPHENLVSVTCHRCDQVIDGSWFDDLTEAADESGGLDTLDATVPCCGERVSLNDLRFDWACGFARFEIAVWNPDRFELAEAELARLGEALGRPVRVVQAHL